MNNIGKQLSFAWMVLTLMAGVFIGSIIRELLPRQTAYYNVVVMESQVVDGYWHLQAGFIKKPNCEKVKVEFVLGSGDVTALGLWEDGDGLPPDDDRIAGWSVLRGKVFLRGQDWDWAEVRTRHLCDGHRVEGVLVHTNFLPEPEGWLSQLRNHK